MIYLQKNPKVQLFLKIKPPISWGFLLLLIRVFLYTGEQELHVFCYAESFISIY